MRRSTLMVAILLTLVGGRCHSSVTLHLTAPASLVGAEVYLGETKVGEFEQPLGTAEQVDAGPYTQGPTLIVEVPVGAHELRIVKEGYEPIIESVRYSSGGEDYKVIEPQAVIRVGES